MFVNLTNYTESYEEKEKATNITNTNNFADPTGEQGKQQYLHKYRGTRRAR